MVSEPHSIIPWERDEGSRNALRDIKTAYKDGNLVLVVGAGVTINSLASIEVPQDIRRRLTWPGLVRDGLAYVRMTDNDLCGWSPFQKQKFAWAEEALQNDPSDLPTDDLVEFAGLVKRGLGSDHLPNWLERCFRHLYPDYIRGKEIPILEAIQALHSGGARVMTTNYDEIMERYCKAKSVLPHNKIDMEEFTHGGRDGMSPGILHVHGHWRDAQNATLDVIDYYRTTSDKPLQELLRQMFNSTAVLVFVGTGGGLDDPNFERLLKWAKEKSKNQPNRHFVLMKDGDQVKDRAVLSPVFYGPKYEDLAQCLQAIADSKQPQPGRQWSKFKNALAFEGMKSRRDAIGRAHDGTCQWIFQRESFLKWKDAKHRASNHGLLWIKGKPGAGKSTLMKTVLEHLERESQCTVLSFFFNARSDLLLHHSTEGCYRSLLHQMLTKFPKLQALLQIPDLPFDGRGWNTETVKNKFCEAVLELKDEHVILVIDALDECDEQEVRTMVYSLVELAESPKSKTIKFNICFASRPYPNITISCCEHLMLDMEDQHSRDIRKYIFETLRIKPRTRELLLERMMQKSQGVFLWAKLVTRRLNEQSDQGMSTEKLLLHIDALPDDLSGLLQRIIIDGASDVCLLPILLWTLAARTGRMRFPIEARELCFAVQFSAQKIKSPYRRDSLVDLDDPTAVTRFVLHSSKGLVETISDPGFERQYCQFVHGSVRDHILVGDLGILHKKLSRNVEAASHAILARWCQEYLRHDSCITLKCAREAVRTFPLLSYAYYHTLQQIQLAYLGGSLNLGDLVGFPLDRWIEISNILNSRGTEGPKGLELAPTASFLYICLESRLTIDNCHMIHDLLKHLSMRPDRGFSIKMFGVSFDTFCGAQYGTPLIAAVDQGLMEVADTLLKRGACANVCADGVCRGKQPCRHSALVLDSSEAVQGIRTPLMVAVQDETSLPMVELLLANKADVNVAGGMHDNALGSAIYRRLWGIVALLERHGADINALDSSNWNIAMKQAVKAICTRTDGFDRAKALDCLQRLIQSRAQATLEVKNTFLRIAAEEKIGPALIETLAKAGADVWHRDDRGRTILHILAEAKGSSERSRTTFPVAAEQSRRISSAEDSSLLTSSVWSRRYRHFNDRVPTAKLLLDYGLNTNSVDHDGQTALIKAAASSDAKLVRFLLENGADTEYKSDGYGTALEVAQACAARYREEVVPDADEYKKEPLLMDMQVILDLLSSVEI